MTKFVLAMLTAVVALIAAGLAVIWSGVYNVAASDAHEDIASWVLDTTMHNSVQRRAREVPIPPSFSPVQVRDGFRSFDAMCVQCHGAPGVERNEWAKGMRPLPPSLAEEATRWNPAEVFWIVQNGIRMTGMPEIGETHSDEEIWNIVAFVEQLPSVAPKEYAALREELGAGHGGGQGNRSWLTSRLNC